MPKLINYNNEIVICVLHKRERERERKREKNI